MLASDKFTIALVIAQRVVAILSAMLFAVCGMTVTLHIGGIRWLQREIIHNNALIKIFPVAPPLVAYVAVVGKGEPWYISLGNRLFVDKKTREAAECKPSKR